MPTQSEAFDRLKAGLHGRGMELLLENIHSLALLLDAQGVAVGWNPAYENVRQACPNATSLTELLSAAARAEFLGSLRDVIQTGTPARVQLELGAPAGRSRYDCFLIAQSDDRLLFIGEPVAGAVDGHGDLQAATGELEKLKAELQETKQALDTKNQELEAVIAQAKELTDTDTLTFLPNRRAILSRLQREVNYSERYGLPLSISMIDLDHFREINTNRGHSAGDQVLRFIASEMRDHIRQPDEIGRLGGDEFLVVLPNTNEKAAAEQANRLCQQIPAATILVGKEEVHIGLSVGIAQFRPKVDDWHTLLERADKALYEAKGKGGGQWVISKG